MATEDCGCRKDRTCPYCQRSHDIPGIGFDINGDDFHVHSCPWCGVEFEAYFAFNVSGAWVGEHTPIFVRRLS